MAIVTSLNPARDVQNQSVPLEPSTTTAPTPRCRRRSRATTARWGEERLHGARRAGRRRRRRASTAAAPSATSPAPQDPRPLRQPRRRGRARPELAPPAAARRSSTSATASPWRDPQPGAAVVRGAAFMLWSNANAGVMCPVSMTHAVVPALRDAAPELAARVGAAPHAPRLRDGRDRRHGDDRAPGRQRRPREHHHRRRRTATSTSSTATSGSAPIPRATSSSCSRRRPAG